MQQQCNPQWETTLNLSKNIVSGLANMPHIEMGLTIQQTFNSPNIRSVFKGENGSIGYSVVNVLVKRFLDSFGFSSKLNESQVEVLTVDILETFAYESLEDIILFLKMIRQGKFGTTNRGVDSNLILGEWLPKYLDLKADLREQNLIKENNERNTKQISFEDVKKAYKKPTEKVVSDYVDKITTNIDRQMLEDLITDWEKDPKRKPYVRILKNKRTVIK